MVFGWVPDPEQDPAPGPLTPAQEVMIYGYLGYAVEEQELSLFDQNAELSWTQDRELQSFEQADIAPETLSKKSIFYVQALENEQYLVQLGLDVFVVDGGEGLLSKRSDEIDSVLNDKVMSVELSVLEVKNGAFHLLERAPGVSVEEIKEATEGTLIVDGEIPEMNI